MSTYDQQTLNSPNPIARFAHRKRLNTSIELTKLIAPAGRVLDYGCGAGAFVCEINRGNGIDAVGYEPYMKEGKALDLPIFCEYNDVAQSGRFNLITLFETIDHLTQDEFDLFLLQSMDILDKNGSILICAPIEKSPALLLKESNRSIFRHKWPEYGIAELLLAAILGIPGKRARNIKISHKGFDFRKAVRYLEQKNYVVRVLKYGPLPIGTWYGNSQIYLTIKRNG